MISRLNGKIIVEVIFYDTDVDLASGIFSEIDDHFSERIHDRLIDDLDEHFTKEHVKSVISVYGVTVNVMDLMEIEDIDSDGVYEAEE